MPKTKPETDARRIYWKRTRKLTCFLLAIWFTLTFGLIFFARELAGITVFGWPFSFYMAAQGLTLSYLLIVAAYIFGMHFFDRQLKERSCHAE